MAHMDFLLYRLAAPQWLMVLFNCLSYLRTPHDNPKVLGLLFGNNHGFSLSWALSQSCSVNNCNVGLTTVLLRLNTTPSRSVNTVTWLDLDLVNQCAVGLSLFLFSFFGRCWNNPDQQMMLLHQLAHLCVTPFWLPELLDPFWNFVTWSECLTLGVAGVSVWGNTDLGVKSEHQAVQDCMH